MRTVLLLLKTHVKGHTRRTQDGRPVAVRPYERVGNNAPPRGSVHVDRDIEAALPGVTAAAKLLHERLLPDYNLRVVPMSSRDMLMSNNAYGVFTSFDSRPRYYRPAPGAGTQPISQTALLPLASDDPVQQSKITAEIALDVTTAAAKERPREALLQTFLHEFGHAFAAARFADADESTQQAILREWWTEAGMEWPHHAPAATVASNRAPLFSVNSDLAMSLLLLRAKNLRRMAQRRAQAHGRRDVAPFFRDLLVKKNELYFNRFGEWFAERFVQWCSTANAPRTAIEQFFDSLITVLRRAFRAAARMLGFDTPTSGPFTRFAEDAWSGTLPRQTRSQREAALDTATVARIGRMIRADGPT